MAADVRCPVCGAVDQSCGGPSTSVPVDRGVTEAQARPSGGPGLVYVEVGPGHYLKLRPEDAVKRLEQENESAKLP